MSAGALRATPRGERMVLEAARLATAAVVVVLGLLLGGGEAARPPASEAVRLVPQGTLAYLHISTDRSRPATQRAAELANRFPGWPAFRDNLLRRLEAPGCRLATQALKTADEAALALFDVGGRQTANSLVLVDAGAPRARPERRRCGALTAEYIGRFLAIGQDDSLAVARKLHAGEGRSLADDPGYRQAMRTAPADRVADGWATSDGIRRLLAPQGGLLGAAGTLIDQPGLRGAAVALSGGGQEARVWVHSLISEQQAKQGRTFPPFSPTLDAVVPEGAMGYLGVSNLAGALQRLLAAAGDQEQALAPIVGQLTGPLLRLFRGESAVIITPAVPAPVLTLVANTRDEAGARRALGQLPAGLKRLFRTAVRDGKVVVSTQQSGVDAILSEDTPRLATTDAFRTTVRKNAEGKVTSLLFLDFNRLLRLGEQTGLSDSPAYQKVKDDLEKVRAIGAVSTSEGSESTTEITLQIP